MSVWTISEYEHDGPSYETKRLAEELQRSFPGESVVSHNIDDLDVLALSARTLLTVKNELFRQLPQLVIVRDASLEKYSQWVPVLSYLEGDGVLCINDLESIQLTANKFTMGRRLLDAGIPTPAFHHVDEKTCSKEVGALFGWPLVVKQAYGTHGIGVTLAHTPKEFKEQVASFRRSDPKIPVMAQQFVKQSFGRDVRAFVIGDTVVAAMLRQAKVKEEFRSNYHLGGEVSPFSLDQAGQAIAIGAARALGLKYAGIDLLFDATSYTVCEGNKGAGFKGLEKAYPQVNVAGALVQYCTEQANACRYGYRTASSRASHTPSWDYLEPR